MLLDSGLYESKEEAVRREEVLGQIDQVFTLFVCTFCLFFFVVVVVSFVFIFISSSEQWSS